MTHNIEEVLDKFEKDVRAIFKLGESLQKVRRDEENNTIDVEHLKKKIQRYIKKHGN